MSYIGTKKIKSVYIGTNKVKSVYVGTNKVYSSEEPYLTFTAAQNNSSVGYSVRGTVDTSGIQYSTDGINWTNWNRTAISLNNGQKMYVRNTNNTLSTDTSNYFNFTMTGLISASGNIMSMINYEALTDFCFYSLFQSCSSLYDISELSLPATTLANNCYSYMFNYCTSLTTPPQLPATTLADSCYMNMFSNCTSLVNAGITLPATTIYERCYMYMFSNCTSLKTPPTILGSTFTGATFYYNAMFYYCTSLKINNTGRKGTPFITIPYYNSANDVSQMFYNICEGGEDVPSRNTTYYYYY